MNTMDDEDELLLVDEASDQVEEAGEEDATDELDGDALILDDEPEVEEAALPNHLRKLLREEKKANLLLRKERDEWAQKAAPVIADVGPAPQLADYDFDEVAHNAALNKWRDDSVKVALDKANTKTPDDDLQEDFNRDVERYREGLSALTFADKNEVLQLADAALSPVVKSAIVQAAKDPAKLQYAIGKSPAIMERLSGIKSLVKLGVEIRDIEEKLVMRTQKKPPAPASTIKGNTAAPSADKTLADLERKAALTGNRSELIKYKKEKGLL